MKATNIYTLCHRSQDHLYTSLTKSFSSIKNLKHLQKIHSIIITIGFHNSPFFLGSLISKYSQFKDPNSSLSIFRQNDNIKAIVYIWNTIIRAMNHNSLSTKALDFYTQMKKLKIEPDEYTFPSVINASSSLLNLKLGQCIHCDVFLMGFQSDLYICNALIGMYSRLIKLDEARKVFDKMPEKDVVSWNSLMSGYSANGYFEDALDVFRMSRKEGVKADCYTISSVLRACAGLGGVEGLVVHGLVEKLGVNRDINLCNILLSVYFKLDKVKDSEKLFGEMAVRNTASWNTMVTMYSQSGLYDESIKLFTEMLSESETEPDLLTMTYALHACSNLKDLRLGKFIHNYAVRHGCSSDITFNNVLIDMYARCGDMITTKEVFERMERKDLVTWNSIVQGYIGNELQEEARKTFRLMKMELQPDFVTYVTLLSMCSKLADLLFAKQIICDIIKSGFVSTVVVGNAIVDVYSKCNQMEDAVKQFYNMMGRDIVTWNSILTACSQSENWKLGFEMVSRMRTEGIMPDEATVIGTLPLCSVLGAKRQGKEMHACILRLGLESKVAICSALIDMYSKTGNLRYSSLVFQLMEAKDIISCTSMITAYGMYGEGKNAIRIFENMKEFGLIPDHIAFIAVIYACSHSGLVKEGQRFFYQLKEDYNIDPRVEHYACMVDLLARSGMLDEAEKFILSMPLQPDASIWGSLLSACRSSQNSKLAERVSARILQLGSDDPGYHVLASNVYAALGKWDKVKMVRKSLNAKGLKKDPGCSWVEILNKVYVFGTGDKHFEQFKEVKILLETYLSLMAKEGYVPNLKFVLPNVGEDEKMELLCGHSERLAIAFGLLNTKPETPLQIMKNLRVCGDCHTVTKYISKMAKREILVRDANRFHLFKDGICSCGDMW
ncbi:hypothetical protein LIER_05759 [Lithospermum erythrorhizon]|uniref:DYW domain-containing protein n=1 Tax=Lithospermum erythrorhizon TaxID=34254 RepID=A0AAV3P1N2_LITER